LGDFLVLQGKLRVMDAFKTRLYVSSGTAGGNSGVWELGMRQWSSSALSVYYDPKVQQAVGLGFYSFSRANSSVVSQYFRSNEIGVKASVHYNGYRPQDEDLKTESLLLNFGRDPLRMLDEWADVVARLLQPKYCYS